MTTTPVETVPNVLVVTSHASFRQHVDAWLPAPAVHLVEAEATNFDAKLKTNPPQLIIIDRQFEDAEEILERAAAAVPGVPYLIVSTDHLDPANPYLFDIASGFVEKRSEAPTRASVLSAIKSVAPNIAARLK